MAGARNTASRRVRGEASCATLRRLGSLLGVGVSFLLIVAGAQATAGAKSGPGPQAIGQPSEARSESTDADAAPPGGRVGSEERSPAVAARKNPPPPQPGMRGVPTREQFLQHALGTQGDVRVPAVLFSLTLLLAVVAVAWKKARRRREAWDDLDDGPEGS